MKQSPAFQFYAADFLVDVIGWSDEEVGVYMRLLCILWVNGGLPKSEKKLQKFCGKTPKKFQKIWKVLSTKFIENPLKNDEIINIRLEETRQKQIGFSLRQSRAGKASAEAKKVRKESTVVQPPLDSGYEPETDQNSTLHSSSSSSLKAPPTPLDLITEKINLFNSCLQARGFSKNIPMDNPDKRGMMLDLNEYSIADHRAVYEWVSSPNGWNSPDGREFLTYKTIHKNFADLLEKSELCGVQPEQDDGRAKAESKKAETRKLIDGD